VTVVNGKPVPAPSALPGESATIGKDVVTITGVSNDGVVGVSPPTENTISFAPALDSHGVVALGKDITLSPTTNTAYTVQYNGPTKVMKTTTLASAVSLAGTGCTVNVGDFWPTNTSFAGEIPNGSNSATGLESNPGPFSGAVTYPSDSNYATSGTPASVTFAKGGLWDGTGYLFGPAPSGLGGGVVTGNYADKAASANIGITGLWACTAAQIQTPSLNPFTECDGAGTGTLYTPLQTALAFSVAQTGGTPVGSDGYPYVGVFEVDVAGTSNL